eukprot:gb/GFBE01009136.1/.p1 GENE.gb/GFBE01009136.1/~~gb/GFBE01009136.1/.p1  ORF type:complete len:138 (+),score=26.12 gb/GFBE01009136.1/:1-414(+)
MEAFTATKEQSAAAVAEERVSAEEATAFASASAAGPSSSQGTAVAQAFGQESPLTRGGSVNGRRGRGEKRNRDEETYAPNLLDAPWPDAPWPEAPWPDATCEEPTMDSPCDGDGNVRPLTRFLPAVQHDHVNDNIDD